MFLDRDGVLNYERGDYSWLPGHFTILPWVADMLALFRKNGFCLIMISNQGGIAKGRFTHSHVQRVHAVLQNHLQPAGAVLDDIYYCPHHPAQSMCLCRKPGSLMLERAMARHGINPAKSYMLGDSQRDMQSAQNAGVKGLWVPSNKNPFELGLVDIILKETNQ